MAGKHEKYQRLLDYCKTLPPTPTAVAHPCDDSSLEGAVGAAQMGLIAPILVGPRARIEAVAQERGLNLAGLPMRKPSTATNRRHGPSSSSARARPRR